MLRHYDGIREARSYRREQRRRRTAADDDGDDDGDGGIQILVIVGGGGRSDGFRDVVPGTRLFPAPVHRRAWCGCGKDGNARRLDSAYRRVARLDRSLVAPFLRRCRRRVGNRSGRGIGRDRSSTSRGDTIRRGGERTAHLSPSRGGRPPACAVKGPLATAALACAGLDCIRITTYNTIRPLGRS